MIQNASRNQCVKRVLLDHSRQTILQASTFKDLKSNKHGLSYDLDSTMRDGHHDMKTFGLGFLRSVSSTTEQVHTMASLRAPYSVLEDELDRADEKSRVSKFWKGFAKDVRKAKLLAADIESLGGNHVPIPAAARYVTSIKRAAEDTYQGDPESRGDLLLGHAYVRYLADLFGGSMLGNPTRLALAYIESFYAALNVAGTGMDETRKMQIVEEARLAFGHNSEIYKERPYLILGAIRGGGNIFTGYVRERLHI
jgi:heme oxygenase